MPTLAERLNAGCVNFSAILVLSVGCTITVAMTTPEGYRNFGFTCDTARCSEDEFVATVLAADRAWSAKARL